MDEHLAAETLRSEGFYDHAHPKKVEVPVVFQIPINGNLRPIEYLDEFWEGWIQWI